MSPAKDFPECLDILFDLNTVFDCKSTVATCHNSARFDFVSLWNITSQYAQRCPQGGPWLFGQSVANHASGDHIALTNDICEAIAGADWKKYPGADIWARLTTWKFPLFQLVANSPRPPLGFWVEAFSFVHFLGDPIGTITDLLRKLDGCQTRAVFWQDHLDGDLVTLREERDRQGRALSWKSLAIIVDSFDEWGVEVGDRAQQYLLTDLIALCSPNVSRKLRQSYIRKCLRTADALAADRSTKFVPVIVAQGFFIATIAIAMIRTRSTSQGPLPTSYINIEMYSIAFTAQFFWAIFAVVWSSIIGTSQTAAALPRILRRLKWDLEVIVAPYGMTVDLPTDELDDDQRIHNGGIYTWMPSRPWRFSTHNSTLEHRIRRNGHHTATWSQWLILATILRIWPAIYCLIPVFIVAIAAGTGQLLSALVPPEGWSCRSVGMMSIFGTWVASYIVSLVPFHNRYKLQFRSIFVKDFLALSVTFAIIVKTQFGIYNRCDCYTQNGRMGLQLPFMPAVDSILEARLSDVYPAIVALGISIQLVLVPVLLVWRYHAAVQVFLQRDDGKSNLDWWRSMSGWFRQKVKRQYSEVATRDISLGLVHAAPQGPVAKSPSEAVVREVE